ncbi:MAG: hypothetical protein IT581_19445 [Verrucomicrobiales bacterium]|nr:hypothetical protein [Verrucomicrobiales bacterium]
MNLRLLAADSRRCSRKMEVEVLRREDTSRSVAAENFAMFLALALIVTAVRGEAADSGTRFERVPRHMNDISGGGALRNVVARGGLDSTEVEFFVAREDATAQETRGVLLHDPWRYPLPEGWVTFERGRVRAVGKIVELYPNLYPGTPLGPLEPILPEIRLPISLEKDGFDDLGEVLLRDESAPSTLDYSSVEDPGWAAIPRTRNDWTALEDVDANRARIGWPSYVPSPEGLRLQVVQADGRWLALEYTTNSARMMMRRYDAGGRIDPTFDGEPLEIARDHSMASGPMLVIGDLPDGRALAVVGIQTQSRLIAFDRTAGPPADAAARGTLLAVLHRDLPYLLLRSVLIRADGLLEIEQLPTPGVVQFPSINGERLRGLRSRVYWKDAPRSAVAVRQMRRCRVVREGAGKMDVEIRRLGNLDNVASVDVETVGGSATEGIDYQPWRGRVSFQPGQVSQKISIQIYSNAVPEAVEFFDLVLTHAVNMTLATPRHRIEILESLQLEWVPPRTLRLHHPGILNFILTKDGRDSVPAFVSSSPGLMLVTRSDSVDFQLDKPCCGLPGEGILDGLQNGSVLFFRGLAREEDEEDMPSMLAAEP